MGRTPNLQLPYPEESDTPDVPRDIKALAEAVDARLGAPVIACEVQARMANPATGRWQQFGNVAATGSRWETTWFKSRFDPLFNSSGSSLLIPYTGLWNVNVHFEAQIGNSTWILGINAPKSAYTYGNPWAWFWDMKINHGMMTSRTFRLFKGEELAFLCYPRDINGAGGQPSQSVFLRVLLDFVGPLEGQPMDQTGTAAPVPFTPDPTDTAQTATTLP